MNSSSVAHTLVTFEKNNFSENLTFLQSGKPSQNLTWFLPLFQKRALLIMSLNLKKPFSPICKLRFKKIF